MEVFRGSLGGSGRSWGALGVPLWSPGGSRCVWGVPGGVFGVWGGGGVGVSGGMFVVLGGSGVFVVFLWSWGGFGMLRGCPKGPFWGAGGGIFGYWRVPEGCFVVLRGGLWGFGGSRGEVGSLRPTRRCSRPGCWSYGCCRHGVARGGHAGAPPPVSSSFASACGPPGGSAAAWGSPTAPPDLRLLQGPPASSACRSPSPGR